MVGRSKPRAQSKPSLDMNYAEILYLKGKNIDLAKALSDSKSAYALMVVERDMLQRELYSANLHCKKLENCLKTIDSKAKGCFTSIVSASNYITETLQSVNKAFQTRLETSQLSLDSNLSVSPMNSSKTQAVKPMVHGHVIFRPTINLRRFNEIPVEGISSVQPEISSINQEHVTPGSFASLYRTINMPYRPSHDAENEPMNDDEIDNNDDLNDMLDEQSHENFHLDTVEEENSNELDNTEPRVCRSLSNNSQVPLLSGVFRDVRVYLSPIASSSNIDLHKNITTERGSNNSRSRKRSFSTISIEEVPKCSAKSSFDSQNNSRASLLLSQNNSLLSSTKMGTDNMLGTTTIQSPSVVTNSNWVYIKEDVPSTLNYTNSSLSSKSSGEETQNTPSLVNFKRSHVNHSTIVNCNNSTDYDPLEGPSHLLDSYDNNVVQKLNTLRGLGLVPSFTESTSSPRQTWSPASSVIKRRENRTNIETSPKNLFITKRKSSGKHKSSIFTKVPKVIIKRMSYIKPSPLHRLNTSTSSEESLNSSFAKSNSIQSPGKKRGRKSKKEMIALREIKNELPSSPRSRGRPRRLNQVQSLKEPSLRKKLRRSK